MTKMDFHVNEINVAMPQLLIVMKGLSQNSLNNALIRNFMHLNEVYMTKYDN